VTQQTAFDEQTAAAARKALPIAARRQGARQMYAESVTAGIPMTAREVGEAFGRSERWGRDRMTEVRAQLAETAEPAASSGQPETADAPTTDGAETAWTPSGEPDTAPGVADAAAVAGTQERGAADRTRAGRYGMAVLLTVCCWPG
jgi:hypothetical protein